MSTYARYALMVAGAILATIVGVFVADPINLRQFDIPSSAPDKAVLSTSRLLAQTLSDIDAVDRPLSQWRGKLLVVNFWATWCAPCREEMPGFSRLQEKYAGRGVQFIGIAFDSIDMVRRFPFPAPVTYPLLIANPEIMQIIAGLGNTSGGLPFTVVLGRDGSLLQSRLGIWKEYALEADLVRYLAE